jgi:hypothetical protein
MKLGEQRQQHTTGHHEIEAPGNPNHTLHQSRMQRIDAGNQRSGPARDCDATFPEFPDQKSNQDTVEAVQQNVQPVGKAGLRDKPALDKKAGDRQRPEVIDRKRQRALQHTDQAAS